MTTTQTKKPQPTALQQLWRDAVTAAVHGQPVFLPGYRRKTAAAEVCTANGYLRRIAKRNLPDVPLTVTVFGGGVCVMPRKWQQVELTEQHRDAIRQIAMHGGEVMLQGVAVLDCEEFLTGIEKMFGVKLVAEYAVWYREGAVPDRACRVRREKP